MDLTPAEALVRDAAGERRVAVDAIAIGADHRRAAGREDSARRRRRRRAERRQPGAGDRRIAAGREGAGRRGVRRDHQRPRRARDPRHAAATRHDARADHPSGRAAQAQRAPAQTLVERFARVYTPACSCSPSPSPCVPPLVLRRAWHDLDLSRAGAAGRLVPVRAGHLDAGVDRRGAGRRGAQGRADQGRRAPRADRRACAASPSTRPAR